jgi:hypothetical protein
MNSVRLITSAAYVNQELVAEFGLLPPAFLPLGTARLYEMQVAQLGSNAPIYMSIPESFVPQSSDAARLKQLGVTIVSVPDDLKIGESIVYALNYIGSPTGILTLLHGDTLVEDINPNLHDVVATHTEGDDYSWAAVDVQGDVVTGIEVIAPGAGFSQERPVACGYFAFSNAPLLVRCITRSRGDFIAGLNLYTREVNLQEVRTPNWRDFGHIQSYFRSRRLINTARSFNTVQIGPRTVRKTSGDTEKMLAEATWLGGLPADIQPYSARLLSHEPIENGYSYTTAYEYAPTLSELFVFSSIGRPTWRNILASCQEFLNACASHVGAGAGDRILAGLAIEKTLLRLDTYARESSFDIHRPNRVNGRSVPSLIKIAEDLSRFIDLESGRPETIMHGDFCFSNILYNSRAARISVIDPRGYVKSGTPSHYGDLRYDLAKLSHSIAGCYDHIIAGRYTLAQQGEHSFEIQFETGAQYEWLLHALSELQVGGVTATSPQVKALTVGLFLSMLPLHNDRPERQQAFIASGLRLYDELTRSGE